MITLHASAASGHSGQFIARVSGRDPKYVFAREFIGSKGGKRGESSSADVDEPGLYETRSVGRKGNKDDSYKIVLRRADGETLVKYEIDKEDAMKIARELDKGRPFAEVVAHSPAVEGSPLGRAVAVRAKHASSYEAGENRDQDQMLSCGDDPLIAGASTGHYATHGVIRAFRKAEIERLDAEIAARRAAGEPEILPELDGWEFVSAKKAETKQAGQTLDSAIAGCWAILQALPQKEGAKVLRALKDRVSAKPTSEPLEESVTDN